MLEQLKQEVCEANLLLPEFGLVTFTWGNVSAIDREKQLVVIKPSGLEYSVMEPGDMVVVDLDGNTVEGDMTPSSDLATHLELYKNFGNIGGIVHTHSHWATTFSQAEREIPCLGTTHADYFYGAIPCTRMLTDKEIEDAYECNTGRVIVETFSKRDPINTPAVVVCKHGPFTWGKDAKKAVENAVVLEEIAYMAYSTGQLSPCINSAPQPLLNKHFFRKHGLSAYYGQKN